MATKNISKVYLLSVPLENDYKNTLYFTSKDAQHSYFASKIVKSYEDFSYQRKDQKIRIPEAYDTIYNCNYVMYQNTAYSNKWFYAFIKELKYISDGVTEAIIETDVIQTWMFDYTIKPSFVEREHVNNDTWGLHTVPEGLETGEFVCNGVDYDNKLDELVYMVNVTEATDDNKPLAVNVGGVFMAGGFYVFGTVHEMVQVLQLYDTQGKGDAVQMVYTAPKKIVGSVGTDQGDYWYVGKDKPTEYDVNLFKNDTLNGYIPRNNKLKCFPYNYLVMSNNNGIDNILHYEKFSTDDMHFKVRGVPVPGGSIKCTPQNYKGIVENQDEGIMAGKFPACSWSQDIFTNWMTQNGLNIALGLASSGLTVLGGVGMMATGGGALMGAGAVVSGGMGIAQTLGQVHQQSFTPATAKGNTNGGDINVCDKKNGFFYYKMSITKEFAAILDRYFDLFGYKVNMVKTPNKAHRSRYWYTKTIDINIDGAIPMDDMQKIKDCYNRGITFWRNASEIQNYDLSNGIV